MAKVKAFTFKNGKKLTGLMAVGNHIPQTFIKHEGKRVGWIQPPKARDEKKEFWIYLAVKCEPTQESPCAFNNILLKYRAKTLEEVKEWLKANTESLITNYDLYKTDMDE
jgi:hypothetical protein